MHDIITPQLFSYECKSSQNKRRQPAKGPQLFLLHDIVFPSQFHCIVPRQQHRNWTYTSNINPPPPLPKKRWSADSSLDHHHSSHPCTHQSKQSKEGRRECTMTTQAADTATALAPSASAAGGPRHRYNNHSTGKQYRNQYQYHHGQRDYHAHRHNQQRTAEDESFAKLTIKYGQSLHTLKQVFASEWSDHDLLTILDEVQGDVDTAIDRISQGHGEKWGEVNKSKKKDKKDSTSSVHSSSKSHQFSEDRSFPDARPSRGMSRGRAGFRGRGRGGTLGYRDRRHESGPEPVAVLDSPNPDALWADAADISNNSVPVSVEKADVEINNVNSNSTNENYSNAWSEVAVESTAVAADSWSAADTWSTAPSTWAVASGQVSSQITDNSSKPRDNKPKPQNRSRPQQDSRSGGGYNKKKAWAPNTAAGARTRNSSDPNTIANGVSDTNNAEFDDSINHSDVSVPSQSVSAPSSSAAKVASAYSKAPSKVSAAVASWAKIAAPAPVVSPHAVEKPAIPNKPTVPIAPTAATGTPTSLPAAKHSPPRTTAPAKREQAAPPTTPSAEANDEKLTKTRETQRLADKPMTHKLPPVTSESIQPAFIPSPSLMSQSGPQDGRVVAPTSNPISRSSSPQLRSQPEQLQLPLPTPVSQQRSQHEEASASLQTMSRPPPGLHKQPGQNRAVQQPRKKQDNPVVLPSNAPADDSAVQTTSLRFGSVGVAEPSDPAGDEIMTGHNEYTTSICSTNNSIPSNVVAHHALNSHDEVVHAPQVLPSAAVLSAPSVVRPDIAAPAQPVPSQYSQQAASQRAMQVPVQMLQPGLPPILNIAPGAPMTVPDANAFAQQMVQLGGFSMSGVPSEYGAWGENRGMMGYYDPNNYGQSSAAPASQTQPSTPKYHEGPMPGLGHPVSTMSAPPVGHMTQMTPGVSSHGPAQGAGVAAQTIAGPGGPQGQATSHQSQAPLPSQPQQSQQQYMPYYQQYGYPQYYMPAPPQQYQTPYGTQYTQPFAPKSMYPPYATASSAPGAQGGNKVGQYAAYGQNQMYGYEDTENNYKAGVYGGSAPGFSAFGETPQSLKAPGGSSPQQSQEYKRTNTRYTPDSSNRNYSPLSSMTGQSSLGQHVPQQPQYPPLSQQPGMNLSNPGNFMTPGQQPNVAAPQQQPPQQQGYPQYSQGYYAYGNQGVAGSRGNQTGYWNQ
ncbi:hypothetical protein SeLEV6574_g04138 [Synchytrium endobioticum]|uniref:CUE domain-containing protein n=1 Tax=Synchytrium endobioticum TaxID=286115 RepID=A0A507D0S2_9FUNG|nr:hypothetical protein SeLEV6574_g04138 [Synchytrium endobioticum]